MVYKIHVLTIKYCVLNFMQFQISHGKEKISKTGFYENDSTARSILKKLLQHILEGDSSFFFPQSNQFVP